MKVGNYTDGTDTRVINGNRIDYCPAASSLTVVAKISGDGFWYSSPGWDIGNTGSVIVVRQDRKPITPNQVEVLADFNNRCLTPYCHQFINQITGVPTYLKEIRKRYFVKRYMSEEMFSAYFLIHKGGKIISEGPEIRDSWLQTVSPFHI
jgi:hypothetical protein